MKRALGLCVIGLLGAFAAGNGRSSAPPSDSHVAALLANGRLLIASAATGETLINRSLAQGARVPAVGSYLAVTDAGKSIYALVPARRDGERGLLVKVDADSGSFLWRRRLDQRTAFRSLVVGPRTGAAYLFGNGLTGTDDVTIARLSSRGGVITRRWTVRRRAGGWTVFEGAVSPSEATLFVSYHGPGTQGADWVSASSGRRCSQRPNKACLHLHGGIEPLVGRVLAATGSPLIWTLDLRGRVLARMDTQLSGNHLMQIALNVNRTKVFAIGSCGYSGGLSVHLLATGAVRTFGHPAPTPRTPTELREGICGERIAAGSRFVVIGKTHRPVPDAKAQGALVVVDPDRGAAIRTIPTSSEPVDVAWLD